MFAWHEDRSGVVRAVTDRSGGVSRGRYSGLNLGKHVDDEPAVVTEHTEAHVEPARAQQPPPPRTVTFDENDDLDVPDFLK